MVNRGKVAIRMLCPQRLGGSLGSQTPALWPGLPQGSSSGADLHPPPRVTVSKGKCPFSVSLGMTASQRREPREGPDGVGAPGTSCLATLHTSDGTQDDCPVLCAFERRHFTGPLASQKNTGMGWRARTGDRTWLIRGSMRSEAWVQTPALPLPNLGTLEK